MRRALFALALPLALAASSCSKKETSQSGDIATHGMSLDYKITNDDGATTVLYIALHVGNYDSNQFACLTDGDQLVVHLPNGESITPQQQGDCSPNSKTVYAANANLVDGTFTVDFVRASGQSALGNAITLPQSFTLAPPAGGTLSRAANIVIPFPSLPGVDVVVGVKNPDGAPSCILEEQHDLGDAAGDSYTWAAGDITAVAGHEQDVCPVVFTVTRKTTQGTFSTEFGYQSQADGEQTRSITVSVGP